MNTAIIVIRVIAIRIGIAIIRIVIIKTSIITIVI